MRGRKKKPNSYSECVCIKLTEDQKTVWTNNEWIAEEVRALIRERLDLYVMKK